MGQCGRGVEVLLDLAEPGFDLLWPEETNSQTKAQRHDAEFQRGQVIQDPMRKVPGPITWHRLIRHTYLPHVCPVSMKGF